MQKNITLPQVELNLENAKVVEVHASVGSRVGPQDILVAVETQKAVEDLPYGESGIVRAVMVKVGAEVNVHDLLAILTDSADEAFSIPGKEPARAATPQGAPEVPEGPPVVPSATEEKVRAIPAARKRAKDLGVDLAMVHGTGPNGRITVDDVEAFARLGAAGGGGMALSARRRALIAQMGSGGGIPQIAISRQLDVTAIAGGEEGTTFTSRLVRHVARALEKHPALRSYLDGDRMHAGSVDVAVAMDNELGLVAPVLRGVNRMSGADVARGLTELRRRAEQNRLSSEELKEGRFAVTNLGMLGVDMFTPLVFSGQTAVLAVGRSNPAGAGGRVSAWFTLAVDHRMVDGAEAARFLETLQGSITGDGR